MEFHLQFVIWLSVKITAMFYFYMFYANIYKNVVMEDTILQVKLIILVIGCMVDITRLYNGFQGNLKGSVVLKVPEFDFSPAAFHFIRSALDSAVFPFSKFCN